MFVRCLYTLRSSVLSAALTLVGLGQVRVEYPPYISFSDRSGAVTSFVYYWWHQKTQGKEGIMVPMPLEGLRDTALIYRGQTNVQMNLCNVRREKGYQVCTKEDRERLGCKSN